MKNLKISQKISSVFFILIVLFLAVVYSSYQSFKNIGQSTGDIVNDAIPTAAASSSLLTSLINQETGVRGYVLTGNESYLQPYNEGKDELNKNLSIIRQHEDLHPIMKDLVENQAKVRIDAIEKFFDSEIQLVKNGQADQAKNHLDGGKADMDAFRQVNVKIQADISKLINDSWTQSKTANTSALWTLGISALLFIIISVGSGLILIRNIVRPIKQVNAQLKEIADGEGDLTKQIVIRTNDEVGDLATSFNKMTESLRDLIRQISLNAEQVAASSEELSASAEQTGHATEQINLAIQEVAMGSERQVATTTESNGIVSEISKGMEQVSSSIQTIANESLKANQNATNGSQIAINTVEQMNVVLEKSQSTARVIHSLDTSSNEIGKIVSLITEIASQTNLLALNAAIESARAGEHGRGFAVVADEVRKLAEQAKQAADQIGHLISRIQEETKEAVAVMEDGSNAMKEGISMVYKTEDAFKEIVKTIQEVSHQSQEVSSIVEEVNASTQNMVRMIEGIAQVSEQNAGNTQNVAASAEEQNASMEEITASAQSLSTMAGELQGLISRFKV
jgi:methyl-accepting chemotaxis protein